MIGPEFKVVDSGDEIETQAKAFTPIAVAITQNAKYFQSTNDVFTENPLTCQFSISSFLFRRKRMQ
jgi:hypothetical protein